MDCSQVTNLTPLEWPRDFHSVVTIQLGELIEAGWLDWEDPSWTWDYYDQEQYKRVCSMIEVRYFYREIGILPPGRWKQQFMRKMNEIMPKYKRLYTMEAQGLDLLQTANTYGKSRNIHSEFPETMLSGNSDYASFGDDREFENVTEGDVLDKWEQLQTRYKTVDVMILEELDELFTCLLTVDMNAF
jgi:hypothetical protein